MKSLSLSKPHLLIMVGIPGSGKSFFAEKFSEMFHAPYVSYDRIMDVGEGNAEQAARYMTYLLHELIKTGQTLVVDGLADTRAQRAELKHLAHVAGYKPLFIWVQTDVATAKARALKTSTDKGRGMTPHEYDQVAGYFMPLSAMEKPVVISGKHTYATQARIVLKNLAAPRGQAPPSDRGDPPGRRNIIIR
jgi:predicted kinase